MILDVFIYLFFAGVVRDNEHQLAMRSLGEKMDMLCLVQLKRIIEADP